jgi:hypothetical protein
MPTKKELERLDLTQLAHHVEKVVLDQKPVRAKALALYGEWTSLFPGSEKTKLQDKKEAETNSLKARMVEFLAAVL